MSREGATVAATSSHEGSRAKDLGTALAALVVMALGVAVWVGATNLPEPPVAGAISASFWPRLIAGALVGLGGFLLLRALWGKTAHVNEAPINRSQWLPLMIVLGTLVVYLSVWPIVGFVPTSLVAILLISKTLGLTQWRRAAIWSLGVTLVVWMLFDQLLGVPL